MNKISIPAMPFTCPPEPARIISAGKGLSSEHRAAQDAAIARNADLMAKYGNSNRGMVRSEWLNE